MHARWCTSDGTRCLVSVAVPYHTDTARFARGAVQALTTLIKRISTMPPTLSSIVLHMHWASDPGVQLFATRHVVPLMLSAKRERLTVTRGVFFDLCDHWARQCTRMHHVITERQRCLDAAFDECWTCNGVCTCRS
jgi:hypothetical protein